MATVTVSTQIDEEECALLDELAEMEFLDRADLIKSAVRRKIHDLRLKKALAAYKNEEATLSRGAEIAGISLREFMEVLTKANLMREYGVEEFEQDLESLKHLDENVSLAPAGEIERSRG